MGVWVGLKRFAAVSVLGLSVLSVVMWSTPARATSPGFGSIQLTVTAPGGGLVDGYCLSATGSAGSFVTAGSGTDGNTGEIVQANITPGTYKGVVYDCGGGGGYTSNGEIKFSVTANIQTSIGQVQLVGGGSLSGQVLDQATGAGAPDVSFIVWDAAKKIELASECTDSDGNYSAGGLPTAGVKIQFVTGACSNDSSYAPQWYDGATSFSTATIIDPTTACCGAQAAPVTLADTTTSKNGNVSITGVTISGSASAPEFTVSGSGFAGRPGSAVAIKPPCKEIADAGKNFGTDIYFNDNSANQWQAGTGGDCIGLVLVSWSDTSIVFTLGSWYSWSGGGAGQGTILNDGDPYTMTVRGAHFTGLVSIS